MVNEAIIRKPTTRPMILFEFNNEKLTESQHMKSRENLKENANTFIREIVTINSL